MDDVNILQEFMSKAAAHAGATILQSKFHKFCGAGGVTGVLLLSESHMSVHTWPEYSVAAFDIYTCGNSDSRKALRYLISKLLPSRCEIINVDRKFMHATPVEVVVL